jgi:hypothetical protein
MLGKVFIRQVVLPLTCLVFVFCTENKLSGVVDDTDTGTKVVTLYLPDKKPAVDALVKFIPSNRSQSTSALMKLFESKAGIAVVHTDNKGQFVVPSLADSTYNVFMEKDSLKAYQGSVIISSQGHAVHDDTLGKTGSFKVTVGLDPADMHNVKSVVIQILGSDVQYVNPKSDGSFSFTNIAAGTYKLRLETSLPGYSTTFYNMTIKNGKDSICSDTIWLNYTGIPSVTGLSSQFDTSSGVVKLKWNSTKYSNILDYVLYRDSEPVTVYSTTPCNASKDTVFYDTIYNRNKLTGQYSITDTASYIFRYRIAVRNNSTTIGNTFGSVSVKAIPYKKVIPEADSVKVAFDTLKGIATVNWKSTVAGDSSYTYLITRNIKASRYSAGTVSVSGVYDTTDSIGYFTGLSFSDSLFQKRLSFRDSLAYTISYGIAVYKKGWKLSGKTTFSNSMYVKPYVELVPLVRNLSISFDTLKGVTSVRWDSLSNILLNGISIVRNVKNEIRHVDKTDTIPLWTSNVLADTIYPKYISFDETSLTTVTYSVRVKHSGWGISGNAVTTSKPLYSYKAFKPLINAGNDQTVDISSDVVLRGTVLSSTYPVKKMEWKLGDNGWIMADSGKTTFKTNNSYDKQVFKCIFRVTDTVGNESYDTLNVTKTVLLVTYSQLPSMPATNTTLPIIQKIDDSTKYLYIGEITWSKLAVWSTSDFLTWDVLTNYVNLPDRAGNLLTFQSKYYWYPNQWYFKPYTSVDGSTWSEVASVHNQFSSISAFYNTISFKNCLFSTISSVNGTKLSRSTDALTWDTIQQPDNVYRIIKLGNSIGALCSGKDYISNSESISWQEDNMWDLDNEVYADNILHVAASDSATLVYYEERPSNLKKMTLYRNGKWNEVPINFSSLSQRPCINIVGNRAFIVEAGTKELKTFTLY